MGLLPKDNPVQVALVVWPWGAYFGAEGLEQGIRAKVSSYSRHHPNVTNDGVEDVRRLRQLDPAATPNSRSG